MVQKQVPIAALDKQLLSPYFKIPSKSPLKSRFTTKLIPPSKGLALHSDCINTDIIAH